MAEVQNIVIKDIRLKTGSKEAWQAVNPVLLRGQPGYEIDTYRNKVGDGTSPWNDLPYQSGFSPEMTAILETMAQSAVEYTSYVGEILAIYGDAPPGTLECDGSLIAIADYADLADYLLSVNLDLDPGDGLNVYLPDLRGEFLRGVNRGGRSIGSHQDDALQNITGNIFSRGNPSANIYGPITATNGVFDIVIEVDATPTAGGMALSGTASRTMTNFNASRVAKTDPYETRPSNTAVTYCIRYKSSLFVGTPVTGMSWPPADGKLYAARDENWARVLRSDAELE